MKNNLQLAVVGAFLLIVILGGTNFVAVRFSNAELAPFWGAGLRFGLASILLYIIVKIRNIPLPKGKSLTGAILYGSLGFGVSYAFLYLALVQVSAGFASVIMSLLPIMTIFLVLLHGLEKITTSAVVGSLIAISGIALLFRDQLSLNVQIIYVFATIGGALAAAESGVLVKKYPKSHPLAVNAVGMAVGSVILILLSILTGESITIPTTTSAWIALGYLTVFGSIALFTLYLFVLGHWTVTTASYSLILMPVVATMMSAWLEGTSVTLMFVISSAIVILGVYIGAISSIRKNTKVG